MLYRIRVWEGLFSIWVIILYRIRVWEGLFSIWVIMLYRIRVVVGFALYLGSYVV